MATSQGAASDAANSSLEGAAGEAALKASSENLPDASPAKAENSVSPAPAKAKAKTASPVKSAPGQVVGKGATDEVFTSRFDPASRLKSLSVKHLQRRLADLGYPEASADLDGRYGALTVSSVSKWQEDNGYEVGAITGEQAHELFDGDPNVTVVVDTIGA